MSDAFDDLYPSSIKNIAFSKDQVKCCINVPSWINLLKTCNMSIGTCIHGTIAAVLSGTPAFVIATSSRILELAEFHNIPHKAVNEFDTNKSLADLYEETDFSIVQKGHKERYENFRSFLKVNGLNTVDMPNTYFEKKIEEINYREPIKNILILSKEETAERFNKIYTNLLNCSIKKVKKGSAEINSIENFIKGGRI